MTEEQMRKTIEFLLGHQATFAEQIQKINASLDKHDQLMSRQNEAIVGLTGIVGRLAETVVEHEKRLAGTEERLAGLEIKFTTLVERVDAFIIVVEKHIAGNGKEQP